MLPKFANSYWLADYRTGIELLSRQLVRSLKQLHEVRKLVFSYMNYHHSNGEFLTKLAVDSSSFDSTLAPLDAPPKRLFSPRANEHEDKPVDLSVAFHKYITDTAQEAQLLMGLSLAIDAGVLSELTEFIKLHEPQVRAILKELDDLLDEYEAQYLDVEALKAQYFETQRLNEVSSESKEDEVPTQQVEEISISVDEPPSDFSFPLALGPVKLESHAQLQALLSTLIDAISTVRRKIPLPGYTNDIFNSSQLSEWLVRTRPHGLNPTRANIEKFGQALVDLKLLVGTGFFARKFTSENMWLEWSPLALHVANPLAEAVSPRRETARLVQDTSKKFNGMLQHMRLSLMKSDYPTRLIELEEEYDEKYLHLQELKHLVEVEVFTRTQTLENFEKMRIELIYHSLTKLLKIVYDFSLQSTTRLHQHASDFLQTIDRPENHTRDLDAMIQRFSTGIYFPLIVSPENLAKKQYSTNQTTTNFQNIKLKFNLYKDFTLQVKKEGSLLSIKSVPLFLFEALSLVQAGDSWLAPIHHQGYWLLKQDLIELISEFEADSEDEESVHRQLVEHVVKHLATKPEQTVNFLKNWLLEVSDSLIPCMVYDALIKGEDVVKQLSLIPRANLASLLYLLEHIAKVFELGTLAGYGDADAVDPSDEKPTQDTVGKLNSMDAIGSVPFVHLILRPSAIKSAGGLKPPTQVYDELLACLLSTKTRYQLFTHLVETEKNFLAKKEKETAALNIPKVRPESEPKKPVLTSPRPVSGEFSLRPFRTGTTPRPSPSASPRHTPRNSLEVKKRDSTPESRQRSSSSSFLAPSIVLEQPEN